MKGRLNIFQATMLRWRELHPYNAVHAMRIDAPLDAVRLSTLIEATLKAQGLTGFVLDGAHERRQVRVGRRP